MKNSLFRQIVPDHKTGSRTGATAKRTLSGRHEAVRLFNQSVQRLLHINNWKEYSGKKGAEFTLTDSLGNTLNRHEPQTGDLIKIKLPAPSNIQGSGYDWVRIEKMEHLSDFLTDEEVFGMRVRPVQNPYEPAGGSAHFYTSDATSTFLIYRIKSIVYAMERGINEVPNTNTGFFNKLRNLLIAIPAMFGLAKPQWQNLMNGILKKH